MQSLLGVIYPRQCLLCEARVEADHALCATCWAETRFLSGLVCDLCGVALPGADSGVPVHCDDCMAIARPWRWGRAALAYRDGGRRLVLALKHGDRTDLARPAAIWMQRVGADLLTPGALILPVPAHWTRLVSRRYNQAALIAQELAALSGCDWCPDALMRRRRTASLDGQSRDQRFATLSQAVVPHPRRGALIRGRRVVLIDDVMTTGATLAASAEAAHAAGAEEVSVLVLARVAKDD